ncbi:hypothetical protein [Brucella pituitosa]|uniref:hypothetical protein n=1 Tax=Brucella pituitosa TaxID=571256 RepID=UPI0009A17F3A|nr:hypothetical protein [Brucella pituitosa]
MATTDDLCFHVEQWADDGGRLETLLSASCNLIIGIGAFEKAVELRANKRLTLRHGARVIRSHTPEPFRLQDEKNRAELERQIEAAQAAYKARSVDKR